MAKKQLGAVDAELLARVDAVRGDVPRVRWVERALEAALENRGNSPLGREALDESTSPRGRAPASPRASQGLGKGYFPARPKGGR